jgi:23S rRNA (guanosine2251-2'-O)-methyltransferase
VSEYLFRRNTVLEVLRANRRTLFRLLLQKDARHLNDIVLAARKRDLPIETVPKEKLSNLIKDGSHQGVVIEVGAYQYSSVEEMLASADTRSEMPLLLLLDLLHGPQNIGMLLRAAEACGVHGVILQDRRAPDITPQVVIYSAGAAEHLHIAQVTNLVQTIKTLQNQNVWIAGLARDDEAQLLGQIDLNLPLGIVVGHEGSGLRRLVRENCDFLVELPMRGAVSSLNASTAGAVALYMAWQARGFRSTPEKK